MESHQHNFENELQIDNRRVECKYSLKYCTLKVFHFVCDMILVILISKLKVICAMFVNRGMKKLILNYTTSDYVKKKALD